MLIGENIKRLRADKGLTQELFAKETGISRSYLSDLENNRKSPTIETLEKIARKMNTSLKFLIGGSETMTGTYDMDQQQWYPSEEPETKKVRVWVEGYADIEIPLDMDKEEAESEVYIGDLTEWHKWSEE